MRMRSVCTIVMSLMLASCAESVHQQKRMGLGRGPSHMPMEAPAPPMTGFVSFPRAEGPPAANLQLYQGQEVSLSGTVLKAKRLDGMTEIEILHLPLDADGRPTEDRRQSQGRFLARQTTFLDPAILATGPTVTVHGVMDGTVDRPLEPGADNYAYPLVAIQDLTIWPYELLHQQPGLYAPTGSATSLSRTDAAADFTLNLLGAILNGLIQAMFSPHRQDYGYSSYSTPLPSRSSPSSSSKPPPEKDIPPQFRKGK